MSSRRAAIHAFLAWLGEVRRLSPRTVITYRHDLERFDDWLEGQMPQAAWADLKPDSVRAHVAGEFRNGLSGVSLAKRLSSIRSFYRWLLREQQARVNPADGIRAPKSPRKLPNVLDVDEMKALLDHGGEADALGARDRAMFELLYSSALRVSELCALRWSDIDFGQALVRVLGKGAKTRVVPFGAKAAAALRDWQSQQAGAQDSPVFADRHGAPVSTNTVRARLKRFAQSAGIWKRVHPHLLRHSAASHLLESSGNLRAVQEMLGHADIGTTQIYTHLDFQHLAKVYDAAHPRARKKPE
ncbi:MAG TPA: tyrosine recombinase XerC [Pseudomonadota bacterium]|jgi:integrase/recombinase XerC|nr:tyrosine recombinase XerC [Pseudomonadota bacterium]